MMQQHENIFNNSVHSVNKKQKVTKTNKHGDCISYAEVKFLKKILILSKTYSFLNFVKKVS